jgi:hypothetical protein
MQQCPGRLLDFSPQINAAPRRGAFTVTAWPLSVDGPPPS